MIYTNRYEPFSSDPPHLIWSIKKKKTINVVKQAQISFITENYWTNNKKIPNNLTWHVL